MTSFKFNFSGQAVEDYQQEEKDQIKWLECVEVVPGEQIKNIDEVVTHAQMFVYGDVEIGHVVAQDVLDKLEDNALKTAVQLAEIEHSDLVEGKYEGGLKIWECTNDLIQYMVDNDQEFNFNQAKVLDLGCGAGILGIYAFMKGSQITFQDYNKEILESVTIPNVLLNIEEDNRESEIIKCKFYSGDWASFNETLAMTETYDIILTSETIYNPLNYEKLIELFCKKLSPEGIVYLAAKTYYFGVGGGTRLFEASIKKNLLLKSEVLWTTTGGIQREILKITRKI